MASPAQLVQFTFAGGIDESTRDEIVDPASAFVFIQNGRQDDRGALTKRHGLAQRSATRLDGSAIESAVNLFSVGKQTYLADDDYLNVYSARADRWSNCGRLPGCTLDVRSLPTPGYADSTNYVIADGCIVGNYYATLYRRESDTWASLIEPDTGVVLRPAESIRVGTGGTETVPLLASYGAYVFAFIIETSAATIQYSVLDTTSAATINTGWAALASAATDGIALGTADLSAASMSDRVAVAYLNNSGGTSRLTVTTFTAAGVAATQTINTSSTTPTAISVQYANGTLWVAWNEAAACKVIGLDPTTLATTSTAATVISSGAAPNSLEVVGSPVTSGAGRLIVNFTLSPDMYLRDFTTSVGAVTPGAATTLVYNCWFHGRPFAIGSRYYVTVGANGTTVVVDMTDGTDGWVRPIANVMPFLSYSTAQMRADVSGDKVYLPINIVTSVEHVYAAKLAVLDFGDPQRARAVEHGGEIYISGALLSVFDGARITESGFVIRPPKPTLSSSGTGLTGDFRYVCVYEQTDAAGNWHVSSVSDPSDPITVADKTIVVTVRPLSISSRISTTYDPTLRISIYRTGGTTGEAPYYYVTSIPNALNGGSTQTVTDDIAVATVEANEKLYAPSLPGVNGGAQDRRPPPGLTHLVSYNGMLVGSSDEDIWYSGQDVRGEGAWFSPIFQLPVSGDGDITGLAAQDGALYVFKRRAIYVVSGDAPTDNGAGGGLGAPRRLAVDVGCVDARSILVTSLGVFFQSERGIEILTRAQGVEWIGEPVRDSLSTRTVVGATLDSVRGGLVYFELDGGSIALVYDLTRRIWQSRDTRVAGAAGNAMVWDESQSAYRYAFLATDGSIYVEQSSYLDDGSIWITMAARTGWVKLGGIQGQHIFNRALLLAKRATSSDISLQLSYDYGAAQNATEWAAPTLDALSTSLGRIQIQHSAHNDAEGQSVRLTIEDSTPTGASVGTGQGATWVALTFEGQPRANAALVSEEAA